MGSVFRFKQFEVDQEGCAMRINTDGVLLGAISGHPKPLRILDIGTGTGVIAMMMAQRFPEAYIDAVEIDESAALRAMQNFGDSIFADRLNAFNTALQNYETDSRYDLIISNPPFFINDLKNTEDRKRLARHADDTFFESVLVKAEKLLTAEGLIWLILPVKQANDLIHLAAGFDLFLQVEIGIRSDQSKPVIRKIFSMGRMPVLTKREEFFIYESEGEYTGPYKQLLQHFFLAF